MCIKSHLATVIIYLPPFNLPSGGIKLTAEGPRPSGLWLKLLCFCWICGLSWGQESVSACFHWLPSTSDFFLPGCQMVPRGSQACAEVLLGFLSVPPVQRCMFGSTSIRPALAAGALSGSRVGSGEGRQHKICLRPHSSQSYKPKQWGRL